MANVISFMENVTNSLGGNSTEEMEAMDFDSLIASANRELDEADEDEDEEDEDEVEDWR